MTVSIRGCSFVCLKWFFVLFFFFFFPFSLSSSCSEVPCSASFFNHGFSFPSVMPLFHSPFPLVHPPYVLFYTPPPVKPVFPWPSLLLRPLYLAQSPFTLSSLPDAPSTWQLPSSRTLLPVRLLSPPPPPTPHVTWSPSFVPPPSP